jgi:hypothetical protein
MNIFALYQQPRLSARVHCDQHLHKMILESAQLVSSAMYLRAHIDLQGVLYKPAYLGHPCTNWTAQSNHNILWVCELADELAIIRDELDCPYHASSEVIKTVRDYMGQEFPYTDARHADPRIFCGPAFISLRTDIPTEEKYRRYYNYKRKQWEAEGKKMTWNNRPTPSFIGAY